MAIIKTATTYLEQTDAYKLKIDNEKRTFSFNQRTQDNHVWIEIEKGVITSIGSFRDEGWVKTLFRSVITYIASYTEKPNFSIEHEEMNEIFLNAY